MEGNKSKMAAGLLGIFLGTFGVHNFYLGYTKKAIIQVACSVGSLILSLVLSFLGGLLSVIFIGFLLLPIGMILAFVPLGIWVWGLVEGIMILSGKITTDGAGNPLIE